VKFATPALALFIIASASGASHTSSRSPGGAPPLAFQQARPTDAELSAGEAAARAQCGTCHAFPPPDILPRPAWRDEIARMLLIKNGQPEPTGPRGTAARIVSLPADWQSILKYYEARAPERLDLPASWPDPDDAVPFRKRAIPGPPGSSNHTVANVRLIDGDRDGRPSVVVSDMRSGILYDVRPQDDSAAIVELARLSNPAHAAPVDLDRDGQLDLLVADLGSFLPGDHDRGAVVWLRGRKDGTYSPATIRRGPRAADVEAADFDGDGRLDLAIASFGWRSTGDLSILKNETVDYDRPSFVPHLIDKRTGSIHTIPADLDHDGRPDLVTLFAQEHETVVAFMNRGGMRLEGKIVYSAPHPNWGSSGIEVVDLDTDGDLDVLMTNGDLFDDQILKPYHGIQWLENAGTFPFTAHTLARIPGIQRAQAADLDRDGDLDIVACALVPSQEEAARRLPSVVWLEQTLTGRFALHVLEIGVPMHATLDVGDLDRDGDLDIVVGNFSLDKPATSPLSIFENLRVRK
jgi:FG-GAP-like repeat